MKNILTVVLISMSIFMTQFAKADLDNLILIRGKIGNSFDQERIKVTDVYNQTYFLPRSAFPKSFVFQSGKPFVIEVTVEQYKNITFE